MNISRKVKRISMILTAMGGLSVLSFNCAPSMFKAAGNSSLSSVSLSSCGGSDCFAKPTSPYTLMTSYQVFATMLNVTGLNGQVSATMQAEYDARTGALADNDSLTSLNAPLQMAATGVAGEVCNALITKETALAAAQRRFFSGVDFNQNMTASSPAAYSASVDAMSRAFWGRAPSSEEVAIMESFRSEFVSSYGTTATGGNQVQALRKLYLSACAAMLSSFDTVIN